MSGDEDMSGKAASDELRKIGSRSEFTAAVCEAIAAASDAAAAEMVFVDADFDAWPIGEKAVVEQLTRWATSQRRLTLVGGSFEPLVRRAPRFVEWRRQWSHILSCRTPEDLDPEQVPSVLLVPGVVVIRLDDRLRYRGTVSTRPIDTIEAREATDALLQRSIESFPATTLGL